VERSAFGVRADLYFLTERTARVRSDGNEGLKTSGDRVVSRRGMTLSSGLDVKSGITRRLDIRFSSRGYSFVGEVESLVAEGLPEAKE